MVLFVLSGFLPYLIAVAKHESKTPWNPLGKPTLRPPATGSDRDGAVMMPSPGFILWRKARRVGNGWWTPTSKGLSILHVDASFKNPEDMPEEQQRSPPSWRERTACRHVMH